LLDDHLFKYRVDFRRLELAGGAAALCVSRPTNPTGNVLTDDEIAQLDRLARERNIPLIIDGAYGAPFPNILFTAAQPHWNENTILVLSLSKLGLPGVRTGIVVAREEIAHAFANANGILNLANGNLGPAVTLELFRTGEILDLARTVVHPLPAPAHGRIPRAPRGLLFRIHQPEGAFFSGCGSKVCRSAAMPAPQAAWRAVVPGHHCFFGLSDWPHRHECIRVSYVQDERPCAGASG
jgi:valine--pyruvate aminotransferase